MSNSLSQRDQFLSDLFDLAVNDPDVILISPDMGAPTIDKWKKNLPDQFLSVGISEQNAINVAAGLSSIGKKVYVYFMACWACRCLEQIRYSCAIGKNPITILGAGVGLGYAPAGPAHNPTDDMTYMRSICGIEIYSPATLAGVKELVNYSYNNRKLLYVRLERTYDTELDSLYTSFNLSKTDGVFPLIDIHPTNACIVTSGYLLGRAVKLAKSFNCNLYDVYKLKPVPSQLKKRLSEHALVFTLEEQTMNCGGFSSMVAEALVNTKSLIYSFGLDESYILENGTRDQLLDSHGLSLDTLTRQISLKLNKIY